MKFDIFFHTINGEEMKKRFVKYGFIIVLVFMGIQTSKIGDEKIIDQMVFRQGTDMNKIDWNSEEQVRLYLLFDSVSLTTKNMTDVLNVLNNQEYKIMKAELYLTPIYQDQLNDVKVISLYSSNSSEAASIIYNKYNQITTDLKLDTLNNQLEIQGVRIRMIEIETLYKTIGKLLKANPNIKYSLNQNGLFMSYKK